jgi:hypothetical protein
VHVLLEKAVEVSHFVIPKYVCDCADLGCGRPAQQELRKGRTGVDLTLKHRLSVFIKERAFERSHCHSKLAGDGTESQLQVAMRADNEMVHEASRALEQDGLKLITWRSPPSSDLCDNFSFNSREDFWSVICHKYFLRNGYWRIGDNTSGDDQRPKFAFDYWERVERVIRMTAQRSTRYSAHRATVVEQHMLRLAIRRCTRKRIRGEPGAQEKSQHSRVVMAVGCGDGCRRKRALGQVELSYALFLLQPQRIRPDLKVAHWRGDASVKAICLTSR